MFEEKLRWILLARARSKKPVARDWTRCRRRRTESESEPRMESLVCQCCVRSWTEEQENSHRYCSCQLPSITIHRELKHKSVLSTYLLEISLLSPAEPIIDPMSSLAAVVMVVVVVVLKKEFD